MPFFSARQTGWLTAWGSVPSRRRKKLWLYELWTVWTSRNVSVSRWERSYVILPTLPTKDQRRHFRENHTDSRTATREVLALPSDPSPGSSWRRSIVSYLNHGQRGTAWRVYLCIYIYIYIFIYTFRHLAVPCHLALPCISYPLDCYRYN